MKRDLPYASTTEQGVSFSTGKSVTMRYVRNTGKSPNMGARFQQDIEPAGRYMLHNEKPGEPLPPEWVTGVITFKKPLVIYLNTGDGSSYDENSWKAALHRAYKKKKRALSSAVKKDGYDAIVTVNSYGTSEIVDLGGREEADPGTRSAGASVPLPLFRGVSSERCCPGPEDGAPEGLSFYTSAIQAARVPEGGVVLCVLVPRGQVKRSRGLVLVDDPSVLDVRGIIPVEHARLDFVDPDEAADYWLTLEESAAHEKRPI